MISNEFHSRAGSFIHSVIRQRQFLIQSEISQKNISEMQLAIDHLNKYLNAYNFNNHQMARFWISNMDQIAVLLPGKDSKSQPSLNMRFDFLTREAYVIADKHVSHDLKLTANDPRIHS